MYVGCLHASVWGVNGGRWNKSKGISSCCSMVVTFIIQTYITGTNPYAIENVCAEESYIIIILYTIGTNFTPLRWSGGVIAYYCELNNIIVYHASYNRVVRV